MLFTCWQRLNRKILGTVHTPCFHHVIHHVEQEILQCHQNVSHKRLLKKKKKAFKMTCENIPEKTVQIVLSGYLWFITRAWSCYKVFSIHIFGYLINDATSLNFIVVPLNIISLSSGNVLQKQMNKVTGDNFAKQVISAK